MADALNINLLQADLAPLLAKDSLVDSKSITRHAVTIDRQGPSQQQLLAALNDIQAQSSALNKSIEQLRGTLPQQAPPTNKRECLLSDEAFYKATLQKSRQNNNSIHLLPPALQPLYTRQKLEDLVVQYKQAVRDIKFEKKSRQSSIAREQIYLKETTFIRDALRTRLESLQTEQNSRLRGDSSQLLDDARLELDQMDNSVGYLMEQLIAFIDQAADDGAFHEQDATRSKKQTAGTLDAHLEKAPRPNALRTAQHVKHLLELLMNKSISTPTDAYIDITSLDRPRAYEPLVHFLGRANVVVEHPRDARLVRLYEFWKDIPAV